MLTRTDGHGPVFPARVKGALLRWCAAASVCLVSAAPAGGASLSDWQHRQEIRIPAAGLFKLDLPPETLDAARPGFDDLRIVDPSGTEVPYVIERAGPIERVQEEVKSLKVALGAASTILTVETGFSQPLVGMTLTTPAPAFIKAVQIEGSSDGKSWRTLARGIPIFRQPSGVTQLHVPVPPGTWQFLRLTVDDRRSPPVPFTGAQVHAAAPRSVPSEPLDLRITDRTESPGETRITLSAGAARLHLAALQIETPEPLFTRRVTLAARHVEGDVIREKALAEAVIFRVAVAGQPPSSQLTIPLDLVTPSRELLLLIRNDDSPPLRIAAIRARRWPLFLVFVARQTGTHAILTGNRNAPAPRYDLASLGVDFKSAKRAALQLSPLAPNPDFRPAEVLPDIPATGPALDTSAWAYRKRTHHTGSGVQQLELDLEVLSHALPTFADLRLMSDGRQLPYILEHTSISRPLVPRVTVGNDPRKPKVSRWALKLPHRNLPVARLVCTTRTSLFRRELILYEETADERGHKQLRRLGRASWVQTPTRTSRELVLAISSTPTTDTLFLETNNEDNPPIELESFQLFYPVWRMHFKAPPDTYLYYGNRRAVPPRYDLSLVATELLTADRAVASLGAEEQLTMTGLPEWVPLTGMGGILFWAMLTIVVVVLLVIISRLLPKSAPPAAG